MKAATHILLAFTVLLMIAGIVVDQTYVGGLKQEFLRLEKKRIEASNALATAKIVHENLNHVRDLIYENMEFPNRSDSIDHEAHIFNLITTCVNDLKLRLVSVKPLRPNTRGRVTTHGYDIELEGDFFKFGELCSKFENNRRIISTVSYKVGLNETTERWSGGAKNKKINVTMRIHTFRVSKT